MYYKYIHQVPQKYFASFCGRNTVGHDSKGDFSVGEIGILLSVMIQADLTACHFPKLQCPFPCSVLASCFTAYLTPTLILVILLQRLISTLQLPNLAENQLTRIVDNLILGFRVLPVSAKYLDHNSNSNKRAHKHAAKQPQLRILLCFQ